MKHNHYAVDSVIPQQTPQAARWGRRTFVKGLGAIAGSATLLSYNLRPAIAEPPPEIRKLRLVHGPYLCYAPQYLAEELLHMEGFSEIEFIAAVDDTFVGLLAKGKADFLQFGAPSLVAALDARQPVVGLSGVHAGCWELFVNDAIHSIRDFYGKSVAVTGVGGVEYLWISSMLGYLGLDPRNGIKWVPTGKIAESMRLFIEGKVDAFLGFAPQPYELRAKKIGRVIVNTTQDRPWSQYFCCMLSARRDFVEANPIAVKRALRAILKAQDICAREPELAARLLVAKGYEPSYAVALDVLKSLPYDRWRQADPADTLRFHALRLHEVGLIKSEPKQIIAQGTDWSFLNELKKELKA